LRGILLDTHVWLWSQAAPEELGKKATAALVDPSVSLYIATISTLEVARLVTLGQIELHGSVAEWVEASLELLHASGGELSLEIACGAYALPGTFHRDPADRVLVATARHHDLQVLTADRRILGYPHVESLDARR